MANGVDQGTPSLGDVLPDVLEPGLAIVFCGSAAGRESARRRAYYAGPGNLFWPTLARVGLTPRRLAPEEFSGLPRFGLGLTDLCKRASGADGALPRHGDDPAALRAKVVRFRSRILAFVGKRPAGVFLGRAVDYGRQAERVGETDIYVLPSPSGAARRYWDERWWRRLARAAGAGG
ncbi:MAG: mismatch-specific DNA-glycosylase [Kiloniellaceae bacterium]